MEAFEILGISFTRDIKEIRKAYSKLLSRFSPETDSEGFQRLRAAYEEAIKKANEIKDSSEEVVLSPIDMFMKDFEDTYHCFDRRINSAAWVQLLERDICFNIDTSKEVSQRMLSFIMDNYNFPTEVWVLFNEHFLWTSKKELLYNSFPKNFIDFVMYKITSVSTFNYSYLKECKNGLQDEFIDYFRKLDSSIDNYDLYTGYSSLKAAEELCGGHPELRMLKGRYLGLCGKINEAIKVFTDLIVDYPKDTNTYHYRGDIYFKIGKLSEAYEDYKRVLFIKPDAPGTLFAAAKCCLCLEKYEEAIKYAEKLDEYAEYRTDIRVILSSSYNFYINALKEKMDNIESITSLEPKIITLKFKLAQAYFKTSKLEECYDILSKLVQTDEAHIETYRLYCRVLISQEKFQLAYSTVLKALKLFPKDLELNFLLADILDELGDSEEALKQYDNVLEIDRNDHSAYNNKAFILNKLKKYNDALNSANEALRLNSNAAHSYKNKAAALLGLELYEDCLSACELSLNIYPYLTEAYIIKMQAYINIRHYDEALLVYNKACDWGLRDYGLYYEKARALMYEKKYDEAIENCNLALETKEENAEVHYIKGLCHYYKDEDTKALLCFTDAIRYNPHYGAAYYYKIKCQLCLSQNNEAKEEIDTAISLKLEHLDRFYSLKGSMLTDERKYEEAIIEFKLAIEHNPAVADYYYEIGRAFNELERFNESIEYLTKYLEIESDVKEAYISMSYALYNLRKYEECINYCDKAIYIDPKYSLAYQNKGWALYRLQYMAEAEEVCSKALKFDGSSENILLLKLRILTYKGLQQDAIIVCDRILEINPNNESAKAAKKDFLEKIAVSNTVNKASKKGLFKSLFR